MNAVIRALTIALVLTMAVPLFAQVRDPRAPTPAAPANAAPSGTGAISGVVIADDSSRPLRMATVVLLGTLSGTLKVTSTDADGRFAFTNLPMDAFTVAASKQPYLGAVAGARRPARPGTALVLGNGQKLTNVMVRLPPAAVITGTITDDLGLPANAFLTAQRRQIRNGETTLVTVSGVFPTDELGRYRIYGLPPGDYIVSAYRPTTPAYRPRFLMEGDVDAALRAASDASAPLPAQVAAGPQGRAVPIFYPASARAADASTITLSAGEERTGIDIRIERAQLSRVDGTVAMPDGQPAPQVIVMLSTPAGAGPFGSTSGAVTGPDGRFNLTNVAPGSYLMVVNAPRPTPTFAFQAIDVTGDLSVNLTLRPPLSFSGRVMFDGVSPPSLAGLTVPFTWMSALSAPDGMGPGARPAVNPTSATGAFTVTGVIPGRYVFGGAMYFGPNATSTTWTLQSVVADGRDITDLPIDLTPDGLPKDLVVTLTDKSQSVAGRLQNAQAQPVNDYTVVVFPADRNYWTYGSRRIAAARPATDGSFTLGGSGIASLPPGQYVLAAVTDISKDEQFDPALLNQLLTAGTPITIAPGERKVQDLVIR